MDFTEIRNKLEANLKPKRFNHTVGVTFTAAAMAMRYGFNIDKTMLAGYLHDCAKHLSAEESISLILNAGLEVTEYERQNPQLLHAKAGYVLAQTEYNVEDEEVLHAILVHTTGCVGMSLLDKIIFIADFIEPARYVQPHLKELRKLAFTDIDECLLHILIDTIEYLDQSDKVIDPTTKETYDFYSKVVEYKPY
ncbi:MAG: bis(5'-nucleosyl)-tetraphosphatase (symmetrical) YqeK [Eubacterium sp.]|nr:bis(5'-nucleosyl)-tetraphosphatase (symmetrical) YqeK [Eubacterium sp.]